jgi:hypothetical protein
MSEGEAGLRAHQSPKVEERYNSARSVATCASQ